MITKMQPEDVCELGKKLGVVNTENERVVLKRIRELETMAGRGEE